LPKIVQARLAESFQLSGRFGGVGRPGEGLAIDYQVIVEIRSFEVQVAGGYQQSYVELNARLMNDRNGTVIATETFEASSSVGGRGNEAYVGALDRAFGEVATEIVDWTARRI
jgi:cholesterol transport system auxiliary component